MSAPVDVLKVIEAEVAELHGLPNSINAHRKARLIAARDAMAGLIEATRNLVAESVHPYDGGEYEDGEWAALDQARAALTRVGGAS